MEQEIKKEVQEAMPETAAEIQPEVTAEELTGEKKKARKKWFSLKRLGISVAAVFVMSAMVIGAFTMMPYGIYVDGAEVCRVESPKAADKAISKAIGTMAVDGTRVIYAKTDKDVKVERINTLSSDKVVSVQKAAARVVKALTSCDENSCDQKPLTVACYKLGEKEFVPDPEYVKDDGMPAGSSKTLEEGKNGRGTCRYSYTVVDGKVDDSDEEIIEVLDAGKSEVIAKGTVGLPPGENWETYEGDPIFSSGSALVATAQKYKGAPYKWGGTNLKTGVSCIGFVKAIYAKYGIKIPMSHPMLKKFGVGVSYENAQPGDIICYKEHTGIYMGGGKMIDAASNRGVGIAKVRPGMVVTVRRVPRS